MMQQKNCISHLFAHKTAIFQLSVVLLTVISLICIQNVDYNNRLCN
ncbi:Uncharacterised protein [Yersinia bercovieri]|nr:Uncharacterised protein [Yersinia bercovieri]CNF80114.1 Uncharacterised protein [Yersinia bercovieri]CNJ05059.1 Uncharacterised protein [Yersinia bercovieri]